MHCWAPSSSAPREVVAVDLNEDKLKLAKQLGATATFNAGDGAALAELREHTGGGVDYAFEMAGSVHAMDFAYRDTTRTPTALPPGIRACLERLVVA